MAADDVANQGRGKGKVVILTGAGMGIGLAITKGLLADPTLSLIVGVDIKTAELEKLLPSENRLAIVQGDVSERATNQTAVETAIQRGGKLDCIILNAAILRPVGPAAVTKVEDWKTLFDVNFFGPLHAIQLALPHLRSTQGHVLMTSSGVSLEPWPAFNAYACAKAAMNWLCACLPTEEDRVGFLCVTPGIVDSGMQEQVRADQQSNMPPEQFSLLRDLHAGGRLLRPEQPASSFVKLALKGMPKSLNGQVVAWDDSRVTSDI